ncbi:MAG TPA: adenylate/guanylate cyclase domain-containing protein [Methylomirabilota bacterium]|nr:adenylate/guanylate cyclase domain-containing protein [Methylomirabilota bacterium]
MLCPRCHAENREGRRFCAECGESLALSCPSCGFVNEGSEKFCGGCGAPSAGSRDAPQARFASPETYTPKHLAEKILTSKTALEGERKQVTVLFADLKGSMELLADRDPEDARKLLDPVLERMMEAVHRYEGTVNQVMGDGIMALFGAPVAHEDHAVRACYAALRMQDAVRRYSEELRHSQGIEVQIRLGLNSGQVVVRSIGNDLHMDYTAVGQTIHLGARMEQLAAPGSTRITADTLALAEGYVTVKSLGPVPVKGLSEPIEIYELVGTGVARTRLQAAAQRGLSRFVGRNAELEQLRAALEKAVHGHGQIVGVVGEPGVGKSRLFWEFTHSHRLHTWLVLESSSASYGKATAYLPVIDLLRAYFQVQSQDDTRTIRERVTGKLLTLDPALGTAIPAVLSLLDVPVNEPAWQGLDPTQRRRETLDAVKRLLLRESQVQPLLVVFEDLHWVDGESQAVLDSLVESLPAARILVLVNYRREYEHRWGAKTYYTQLRLDPLPVETAGEMLDALLGADAGLHPVRQLLLERTEGNPFFLEECVRTLIETKVLVGERGAYRATGAVENIHVPATVQAILAARIDRLPPEDKALLQVACVVGEDVPLTLLQAVAAVPDDMLRAALARLQAAEFLYEAALFPDVEYTFTHGLTYQVAYGSLLHERRRHLHARAAEALERLAAGRVSEHVERLAHHAQRGELWERAVVYLRQAGAKALARSASREAAAAFEQALAALAHLPEGRATVEQAIDLRFELRQALQPLGEHQRVVDYLREAETLAATLDDQRRMGWVSAYLGQYYTWLGEPERAAEAGHRALSIGGAGGDFGLQVVANVFLGLLAYTSGDYQGAKEHLRWNVDALTGDRVRERFGLSGLPAVLSRNILAFGAAELGEFTEAAAYADEGLRIAESVGLPYSLIAALQAQADPHLAKGDADRALPPLERALALCGTWNLAFFFPLIAQRLGSAYARVGRIDEAVPLLERAIARLPVLFRNLRASLDTALGEAYLLAGRPDAADEEARRALTVAQECRTRGWQAWALRLLGEVSSQREPPRVTEAQDQYRDALALATSLGMRPLVAHCEFGLGKLYGRTSKPQDAREHLTTAMTMYREMDMQSWMEKVEQELKSLA